MFANEELDSHADSGSFGRCPVVIGGWLFSVPCTYFADVRDCQKSGASVARLKASVEGFSAMREENIEAFLAASSAEIAAITIAGLEGRPQQWWGQEATPMDCSPYQATGFASGAGGLLCTESQVKHGVMRHCLLRFMRGKGVYVEVKFATQLRDKWVDIEQQARTLIRRFQVKRLAQLVLNKLL